MFSVQCLVVLVLSAGFLSAQEEAKINYVCLDCLKLVEAALAFMSDKPIQNDVVNMLDNQVCSRLNAAFMKECTDQVEGVVPYFMSYLQSYVPKLAVCQEFNLCPYAADAAYNTPIPPPPPTPTKDFVLAAIQGIVGSGPAIPSAECQYCQLAEGEISMLLQNQQAKNIVKEYLGEICDDLPFNSVQCEDLLGLYIDQVFHITQGYLEENMFCVEFEICPKAVDSDDVSDTKAELVVE
eukprot:TRINITY_DN2184_c1_g1_i1.p3 TRINITY_DN2184_c1_g1~~TRINITY_DN2184_c1_g1_i1.p3  ORF type:complete len:238 (+),score=50.20 TRINITY_DN2184_c1_g1_i1:82-795(+)